MASFMQVAHRWDTHDISHFSEDERNVMNRIVDATDSFLQKQDGVWRFHLRGVDKIQALDTAVGTLRAMT